MKRNVEVEYRTNSQAVIKGGLESGDVVAADVDTKGLHDGARVYR